MVGVSSDDVDSHEKFANRHSLPFELLADPAGVAREAFGVRKTLGILPGRATYVIDKGGVVRHTFNSQMAIAKHVSESLETVKGLAASP